MLAKKRDLNEMGPPETLRWTDMEVPELELSLDLEYGTFSEWLEEL